MWGGSHFQSSSIEIIGRVSIKGICGSEISGGIGRFADAGQHRT